MAPLGPCSRRLARAATRVARRDRHRRQRFGCAGALHLPRGYWVTVTAVIILQPYTGVTTVKAVQRVIGTVVGGILTAALGALFHDIRAILVLSFIFAGGERGAVLPINYTAFSVFLTPTFVLLAEASAGDWHLATVRVINTLLGGVLALLGARLLWPAPEWRRLPTYMAAALRANRDYLRTVVSIFPDRSDAAGERCGRGGVDAALRRHQRRGIVPAAAGRARW